MRNAMLLLLALVMSANAARVFLYNPSTGAQAVKRFCLL
jgi:hypothetical protein